MKLFGIMTALMNGYVLHVVRSKDGSEQEVIIEKVYKNATVPNALISANSDFSCTEFPDNGLAPEVIDTISSEDDGLDFWVRKGGTLDAYYKDGNFVAELTAEDTMDYLVRKTGTHPESLNKAIENAFKTGAKRI
jgi:hypothetical protein